MKRKIYDKLLNWKRKSAGKTALLIDGARRVGKSFIVEEFAKAEYGSYVLVDFSKAATVTRRPPSPGSLPQDRMHCCLRWDQL